MSAEILDGEAQAIKIKEGLKTEIQNLTGSGVTPHLAAIQVGSNPASSIYIKQQQKACKEIDISYDLKELVSNITQDELIAFIEELNQDKNISGIILQMPLPAHLNARTIQVKISPAKDVEGVHPVNMGMLVYGNSQLAPPTALAAMELLKLTEAELKGKEVVVVGHSEIVGKPLALLLLQSQLESPTPTVCHIATRNLAFHTSRADVLFVAAGKPGLIRAEMLKEAAIVIDIGINRVPLLDKHGQPVLNEKGRPKKKTVGDVDFERAKEVCSFISPVPGGVGPLTVTMLLKNTVTCTKLQK